MYTEIVLGLSAIWMIIMVFMMTTSNFRSMFFFQFTPFCLAVACFVALLFELGMIVAPVTPLW